MSLYRRIFKRALFITWYNKYLWFFGLFAAVLGGAGKYEISLNKISRGLEGGVYPDLAAILSNEAISGMSLSNFSRALQSDPVSMLIIIGLVLILVILGVFMLWLSVVSQAGLINSAAQLIKRNKRYSSRGIKEGVEAGMKYFWPVLGWNLIIKTFVYAFFVILSLLLLSLATEGSSSLTMNAAYVFLFLVFIPAALILSLLLKYAVCFVVIKGKGFIEAMEESWRLFVKNWLISIETAFLLFLFQFLITAVLLIALLVLAIPFLFLVFLTGGLSTALMGVMLSLGLFLAILGGVLVGAVFTTFELSSWTTLFLELTGKRNVLSKLARLFPKLAK